MSVLVFRLLFLVVLSLLILSEAPASAQSPYDDLLRDDQSAKNVISDLRSVLERQPVLFHSDFLQNYSDRTRAAKDRIFEATRDEGGGLDAQEAKEEEEDEESNGGRAEAVAGSALALVGAAIFMSA